MSHRFALLVFCATFAHVYATTFECVLWGVGCTVSVLPFIMAGFFIMWNAMCSEIPVAFFVRLYYFGYRDARGRADPFMLLIPHWYIGVIVPTMLGGMFASFIAVVLPYSHCIYKYRKRAKAELADTEARAMSALKTSLLDALIAAHERITWADHQDDAVRAVRRLSAELAELVSQHAPNAAADDGEEDAAAVAIAAPAETRPPSLRRALSGDRLFTRQAPAKPKGIPVVRGVEVATTQGTPPESS